ncbi:ABC-type transport system, involved in lipoprotein release, permease component [Sphaerochaeta pleomorpha str. Grapes]|uniref:ABC-type transport system, involved in lipoprotein release, permease component n=1 Tax=Sphaerochaeta pleomorpha (strain ATCC BAA-1885 / DSM 22778 / Grapes) TaxID=158190 RepID=G8QRZ4_SPHPG|nr:FtsX-like permease family protein [Sphaerochaeta pleomorpha]AEV29992.1 ABC-type transport system, involved in lipoprotein release, permease component [Sphaerochaeta pleomorpha str. Grapes]
MKFLFSLAMKNLTRYKRRTIITASAIALGLMMYIIVDSVLMGAEQESIRNLKWYETSSARIYQKDYWDERLQLPLDRSIQDTEKVLSLLQDNGWTGTPRTMFSADMILYSDDFGEDGNLPVLVTAIDPERDNAVFHYSDTLEDGRFLEKGEENGILLGSWLAEDIGAKVGYWVTLVTRGNGGFYEAMDMQVVGILNCPNPNVNRTLLMMDLDTASEHLAMDGSATEIDVFIPDDKNTDKEVLAIGKTLASISDDLQVYSWEDLAKDYLAIAEAKRGGSSTILFLVFIIAAVGISNTMLMAMYERTRELGMMRALGMPDRQIRWSFIIEAGGIGLIGSIIGVVLGILFNIYLVNVGINYGMLLRDIDIGYRIQNILRGTWSFKSIIVAFLSGIILSMLVALLPTRRALKMDIPSCLRHQ